LQARHTLQTDLIMVFQHTAQYIPSDEFSGLLDDRLGLVVLA